MAVWHPNVGQSVSLWSLYCHIPFCRVRCSYCAFNTYAGLADLIPAYVEALCEEITWYGRLDGVIPIHTVYFGGGTPSILAIAQLDRIMETIAGVSTVSSPLEVTLEANPATLHKQYLRGLRQVGITRLSIGAQSAVDADLQLFRRDHDWSDVVSAFVAARQVGFKNISLDLIYGAPGQKLKTWQQTLQAALALQPAHLSLYSLTIEPGTLLHRRVQRSEITPADPDLAADMYECASEIFAAAGYEQYEISNWALPGYACQHNIQYWRNLPYLGVGAGAHGYLARTRYVNVLSPHQYVERLSATPSGPASANTVALSPAVDLSEVVRVTEDEARADTMILGLRLLQEGVSARQFQDRHGMDVVTLYGDVLERLAAAGLVRWSGDAVQLTRVARLVSNQALRYFV